MNRLTKDPALAMRRLANHVGVKIVKKGKLYGLRKGMKINDPPKNAKRCLARMIRVAQYPRTSGGWGMERDDIRDVIRLTRIDSFGTVAHEEQSIQEVLS